MSVNKSTNLSITSQELAKEYKNLNKSNHVFLFIWMNGCGHCEHMKPEWDKLKNKTELSKHKVIFVDVESELANLLPTKHGVINGGYPTLKLIKIGGKDQQLYDGGRTSEDMSNFIMVKLTEPKKMMGGMRTLTKKYKVRKTRSKKIKRVRWSKKNSVRIISPRKMKIG